MCTCYGAVEDGRSQVHCTLWRIEQEEGPLTSLSTLQHEGGNVRWWVLKYLLVADAVMYLLQFSVASWLFATAGYYQ